MKTWSDGTPKSTNNFFTLRPSPSCLAELFGIKTQTKEQVLKMHSFTIYSKVKK